MWKADGEKLYMSEGDWGVALPFTVSGVTINSGDTLRFNFKTAANGETIFAKVYTNIVDNTVQLTLTQAESAMLTPGTYVYNLEWYQAGHFMCCIIENARFKVGDVA